MKKRYLALIILASLISANIATFLQIPYSEDYNVPFKDKHIKIGASDIMIITPENLTYTAPMSGYYPAAYGFEEDTVGGDPAGWVLTEAGGNTVNVIAETVGHNKVLEFHDVVSGGGMGAGALNYFDEQEYGTIEFWWRVSDDTKISFVYIGHSVDGIGACFRIDNNVFAYYYTGWNTICASAHDTWYHIRVDFECGDGGYMGLGAHRYTIYINGVEYGQYEFRIGYDLDTCDYIFISTGGADSGFYVYTDAIGLSWEPNYNIGDNLNEGLLLSFENTTALDWVGFSLDGSANKTILGNTTIPIPLDGLHNIQVFGNSSIGAIYHSDIRYFTVDTTPPQLSITYPTTGAEFSNPPSFILSITEENVASTWYTLNGGSNIPFTGITGVIDSTAWNSLPNGPITIRFYVRDVVDSEDFDEVIVIKTSSQEIPPDIPGYNILILIGISLVIIGVFAKRKLKF